MGREQSPTEVVAANVTKAATAAVSTHIGTTASYIARSLDPEWNEHVEVDDYQTSDALEFHVMDYDYLTKDDWLGTVTISDADLAKRKFYKTLPLGDDKKHGANGKMVKGKLTVQVLIARSGEMSDELGEMAGSEIDEFRIWPYVTP